MMIKNKIETSVRCRMVSKNVEEQHQSPKYTIQYQDPTSGIFFRLALLVRQNL